MNEYLRKGIKILHNDDNFVVWLKLDRCHFVMEKSFYIGTVYIAPASGVSKSDKYEIWDKLEEFVIKYNDIVISCS